MKPIAYRVMQCWYFNTGYPPIRARKLKYFEIPEFLKRAKRPSPSRISISHTDEEGRNVCQWFMASCERNQGSKNLSLTINTYSDFPAVRLVVKQAHIEHDTLLEFEYMLCDTTGAPVDRALTLDDLHMIAKPVADVTEFDPKEAFEVHFIVKETERYPHFSQKGFCCDISVFERQARKAIRDLFHTFEAQEGKPTEPTIEGAMPNHRYTGKVLLQTDHYLVLHRLNDREQVSLHRKSKLDKSAQTSQAVIIQYSGKKGIVLETNKYH